MLTNLKYSLTGLLARLLPISISALELALSLSLKIVAALDSLHGRLLAAQLRLLVSRRLRGQPLGKWVYTPAERLVPITTLSSNGQTAAESL